jgi:hypothetical protein
MSLYTNVIVELTKCTHEEAIVVEALMRANYGTLDGLDRATFRRESKKLLAEVRQNPKLAETIARNYGLIQKVFIFHPEGQAGGNVYNDLGEMMAAIGQAPRALTEDEVRDQLLEYVWAMIHYWEKGKVLTTQEKLEGLAFSLLSMLDGDSANLPRFIVAPNPHPSDVDYRRQENENYFPENLGTHAACNLGGSLHEFFYARRPR